MPEVKGFRGGCSKNRQHCHAERQRGTFLLVIPRCPERSEGRRGISWGDPSFHSGWQASCLSLRRL